MNKRLELSELLHNILGSDEVYFQSPESKKMNYPAIIYSKSTRKNTFANNNSYIQSQYYNITVIDKDPDSKIVDEISMLPRCRHDRTYVSDNLNHNVFTIYY